MSDKEILELEKSASAGDVNAVIPYLRKLDRAGKIEAARNPVVNDSPLEINFLSTNRVHVTGKVKKTLKSTSSAKVDLLLHFNKEDNLWELVNPRWVTNSNLTLNHKIMAVVLQHLNKLTSKLTVPLEVVIAYSAFKKAEQEFSAAKKNLLEIYSQAI